MQRACDWLIDRHLQREVEPVVRAALRLGAYQLHWLRVPAHAAVSATVTVAPERARGLVNAVLRKVASVENPRWPDPPTKLSYPDWIVDRLAADLGPEDALAALDRMNEAPLVTTRDDGYVQDLASQWVADAVGTEPGDLVRRSVRRARRQGHTHRPTGRIRCRGRSRPRIGFDLIADNIRRLGAERIAPMVGDGARPPLRGGIVDRVLVDAPCSGLGVLRRRPDARWRIEADDVVKLVQLQQDTPHRRHRRWCARVARSSTACAP